MKIGYLSLDLDFWNADHSVIDEEFVHKLVGCFTDNERCVAAFDHHNILPHVSRYWDICNTLVNQDWHSDLGGYDLNGIKSPYWRKPGLNCGTWCDHVWWKNMDLFVWGYPTTACAKLPDGDGRCDDKGYNAFEHGHTDWLNAIVVHAKCATNYNVRFEDGNVSYTLPGGHSVPIVAMSFVWSKQWAGDDAKGVFMRTVKRYNIHIIDGLRGKTRKADKRG
jgi:hypothetical protein